MKISRKDSHLQGDKPEAEVDRSGNENGSQNSFQARQNELRSL